MRCWRFTTGKTNSKVSVFTISRQYESTFQEFVPLSLLGNFWSNDGPLCFRPECVTYLNVVRLCLRVCARARD
jgi:hypothetical protein